MSQLLATLNLSLATIAAPLVRTKREFIAVGDSLLLKNEFEKTSGVSAADFPDSTGFECFVNHVHLPFNGTQRSLQSCLEYAVELRDSLAEVAKGRVFNVMMSLSDNDCVVRFHQLRENESWLDGDLDAYREEAILVLAV